MKSQVNEKTGEVLEPIKFNSMWFCASEAPAQDLSNEFEEVFEEVAPFAMDPATGEFLNNTSVPKIVSKGKINVHEKIQSFAKDVDLYSILEKFAYSEDSTLLNRSNCEYGDISDLPTDLNGYAQFVNKHIDNLTSLAPELGKMVIDENVKPEDIEAKANEILKSRLDSLKEKKEKEEVK